MKHHRVIPVATFTAVDQGPPVAEALLSGGIGLVEVTLRTDVALAVIEEIRKRVPSITVGAGTLRQPADFERAINAGAQYVVTPGTPQALLEEAAKRDIPCLPGASTVTEMMHLQNHGYGVQKFFPAEMLGGPAALELIKGPLPDLLFCPSGNVDESRFTGYLELDNVLSVGGSWMTPPDALQDGDWSRVEQIARRTQEAVARTCRD